MKRLLLFLIICLTLNIDDVAGKSNLQQVNPFQVPAQLSIYQNTDYSGNDLQNEEPQYFRNYAYIEVWGHSWFSLNYNRLLP